MLAGPSGVAAPGPQRCSATSALHPCHAHPVSASRVQRSRGRVAARALAPDTIGTELESVETKHEMLFQPEFGFKSSPQGNSKNQGSQGTSYDLARLLETWDKAVATRTYNLMSQLDGASNQTARTLRRPRNLKRAIPSARPTRPYPPPRQPSRQPAREPNDSTSTRASTRARSTGSRPTSTAATTLLLSTVTTPPVPTPPTTGPSPQATSAAPVATSATTNRSPAAPHTAPSHIPIQDTTSLHTNSVTIDLTTSPTTTATTNNPATASRPQARDVPLFKRRQWQAPVADMPAAAAQQVPGPGPVPVRPVEWTVDDVLRVVTGSPPPHLRGRTLDDAAQQAHMLPLHTAIKVLGKSGNASEVERLLIATSTANRATTYTWGTSFLALADAGRFDLALNHLERACRSGVDIGPVGASCLVKVAAQQRNLDLALDLYYKMLAARVTFSRHVYNCIIHLCGLLGRVNDALDILTHMQTEAESNSQCRPDCYTYSAVLYAISTSQRWEHLNNVFFALLEQKLEVSAEVWCQLISGAGRADRLEWAEHYYKAYRRFSTPQIGVENAYMWAISKAPGAQLERALHLYQRLPHQGLQPDSYTYVALLSLMARGHCDLALVESIVSDIRQYQLQLNTQLGTALLNVYKRVPELSSTAAGVADAVLERIDRLMNEMVARRLASTKTFSVFATIYILAGRGHVVPRIIEDAARAGCELDAQSFHFLHTYSDEVGLSELSEQCRKQRDVLMRQGRSVRRREKEKLALRAAGMQPGRQPQASYKAEGL